MIDDLTRYPNVETRTGLKVLDSVCRSSIYFCAHCSDTGLCPPSYQWCCQDLGPTSITPWDPRGDATITRFKAFPLSETLVVYSGKLLT